MALFTIDPGAPWEANDTTRTFALVTRQYAAHDLPETLILTGYTKNIWMLGRSSSQVTRSITELITTFCGPTDSWALPRELYQLILELAGVLRVGTRTQHAD